MSQETPDPRLGQLETALARLTPLAGKVDRDALLFRAGQASVPRGWLWPAASAASTLLAAALGFVLLLRPEPQPVIHIVKVVEPAPEPPRQPAPESAPPTPAPLAVRSPERWAGSSDYMKLREQVIRWGDDALPSPPPTASTEPAPGLDDLLDLPRRGSAWPARLYRNSSRPGDSL